MSTDTFVEIALWIIILGSACLSSWLFFIGSGIWCFRLSRELRTLRRLVGVLEEEKEQLALENEKQGEQIRQVSLECQALGSELETTQELVRRLREENERLALEEWFRGIVDTSYRNETEVEVKFVYPLVRFLGYSNQSVDVRVPVEVRVGRKQIRGEADWVLWDRLTDPDHPHAIAVIEAKAFAQPLDNQVQSQARSYAFGLDAPTYAITNGQRLQIFRRGIQSDDCLVDCTVDDLSSAWPAIQEVLGPTG